MNGRLKFLFVINARAGAKNVTWQKMISSYFTDRPYDINYFFLKKNIDELKKNITVFQPSRVIAVGGDGTVALVAKLITGTKALLGILPAGSANGMAKELNIPLDPAKALEIIEKGDAMFCDAIKINNQHICLHLADMGINAQLIKYFDEGKLRGWPGYAKVILKTLWHSQKITVDIQTNDTSSSEKVFMVVLANASRYGTGAIINPDGKTGDGKFEVVLVRQLSFKEVLKTLFRPKQVDRAKIEAIHVRAIKIRSAKNVHFQVDGEYKGKINKLEAVILPKYISILRGPGL